MAKKKKKNEKQTVERNLAEKIKKIVKDLYYISETDAEIVPFVGEKTATVAKETVLAQTGNKNDAPVEERRFEEFFSHLTEIQDWYGEEEISAARKFSDLRNLLQEELKGLKVFKIGNIELDVYVVGLNSQGILMGVKTKAVET